GQAKTPAAPKPGYPNRPAGSIEVLFKAPGQSANGMQCTDEGIWTIDVAGSRTSTPGRCKVYLSSYEGKLLRELAPEGTGPSGSGDDRKWAGGRKPGGWTGCGTWWRDRGQSRSARARHRRARDPDPGWQALDGRTASSNDLPDRPEDLDGRVHVSDRRLPPARRRDRDAGRARPLGVRHEHGWVLQARHGHRRDRGFDSIAGGQSVSTRHVGVEGLHLLDRRHRRRPRARLPSKDLKLGIRN